MVADALIVSLTMPIRRRPCEGRSWAPSYFFFLTAFFPPRFRFRFGLSSPNWISYFRKLTGGSPSFSAASVLTPPVAVRVASSFAFVRLVFRRWSRDHLMRSPTAFAEHVEIDRSLFLSDLEPFATIERSESQPGVKRDGERIAE